MSKKENKVLDPFTVIVTGGRDYIQSRSVVNHADGSIAKDTGRDFMKDIFDDIQGYATYKKFKFSYSESDFQDICERVGIAYVDKCHEFHKAYWFDVLKPTTLLVKLHVLKDECDCIDIELLSDLRHYNDGKLSSVSKYFIEFHFIKATCVKGKELVTNIYPFYADSHEDR